MASIFKREAKAMAMCGCLGLPLVAAVIAFVAVKVPLAPARPEKVTGVVLDETMSAIKAFQKGLFRDFRMISPELQTTNLKDCSSPCRGIAIFKTYSRRRMGCSAFIGDTGKSVDELGRRAPRKSGKWRCRNCGIRAYPSCRRRASIRGNYWGK